MFRLFKKKITLEELGKVIFLECQGRAFTYRNNNMYSIIQDEETRLKAFYEYLFMGVFASLLEIEILPNLTDKKEMIFNSIYNEYCEFHKSMEIDTQNFFNNLFSSRLTEYVRTLEDKNDDSTRVGKIFLKEFNRDNDIVNLYYEQGLFLMARKGMRKELGKYKIM